MNHVILERSDLMECLRAGAQALRESARMFRKQPEFYAMTLDEAKQLGKLMQALHRDAALLARVVDAMLEVPE
jgi:hypothetical protein